MSIPQNSQTTTVILPYKDIYSDKQEKLILFLKKMEKELKTALVIKFENDSNMSFNPEMEWENFQKEFSKLEYRNEQEIQDFLKNQNIISS